jgi:hypothetical protein
MEIKKVFIVTPLGSEDSEARIHAAKMLTKVFQPLGRDLECVCETAITQGGIGAVADEIFGLIYGADVIIADTVYSNLNVFYEIGLAHALRKPVIIISPNDVEPFDVRHLRHIKYDKNVLDSSGNAHVIHDLKENLKQVFKELGTLSKEELLRRLPFSRFFERTTT